MDFIMVEPVDINSYYVNADVASVFVAKASPFL